MSNLTISLLQIVLYALFIAILVRVVFSYISPFPRNPVHRLAWDVTEPILQPVRRVLPPTMGFDLSPMIVSFAILFLLQIVGRYSS